MPNMVLLLLDKIPYPRKALIVGLILYFEIEDLNSTESEERNIKNNINRDIFKVVSIGTFNTGEHVFDLHFNGLGAIPSRLLPFDAALLGKMRNSAVVGLNCEFMLIAITMDRNVYLDIYSFALVFEVAVGL